MARIYQTAFLRDKFIPFDQANLSIASSPVLYGLSSYSVMPVFLASSGELNIFRINDHFKRLVNSSKTLNFTDFVNKWDEDKFIGLTKELIKKNNIKADSLIRATVFVDAILAGTKMIDTPHELSAFVYDMQPVLPKEGARLMVSSWRRTSDNAIPVRAKVNGSYVNSSLMKNEALSYGFDDAIALSESGHVTESTVSNIFLIKGGQIITPSTELDILEGITRSSIKAIASDLDIPYTERIIARTELYSADEVFLCGSSVNITPVLSIDNRSIGNDKPGEMTIKLAETYTKITHGQLEDKHHWLTKV